MEEGKDTANKERKDAANKEGRDTANKEREKRRHTLDQKSHTFLFIKSILDPGGRREQKKSVPAADNTKVSSEDTRGNSYATVGSSKEDVPHSDRPRNWSDTGKSGLITIKNETSLQESNSSMELNRRVLYSETNHSTTDLPRNLNRADRSDVIATKNEPNLLENCSSNEIKRHDGFHKQVTERGEQTKTVHGNEFNRKSFKDKYSMEQKVKNVCLGRSKSFVDEKENSHYRTPDFNRSNSSNQKNPSYSHSSSVRSTENKLVKNYHCSDASKLNDFHSKRMHKNNPKRDSSEQFKNSQDCQSVQKNTERFKEFNARNRNFFRSKSEGPDFSTKESAFQECLSVSKNSGNVSAPRKSCHHNEEPDESILFSSVNSESNSEINNEFKFKNCHSKSVSYNMSRSKADETFDYNFRIKPDGLKTPKRNIKKENNKIVVSVSTNSPFISEEVKVSDEGDFSNYLKEKDTSTANVLENSDKPQEIDFNDCPEDISQSKDEFFQPDNSFSIPPPHPRNNGDNCCSPGQTSGYISIGELETLEGEVHCSPERINEITSYLKEIQAEQSKSFEMAGQVLKDINKVVRYHFRGDNVIIYGSYLSNLATISSNINLAIQTNQPPKNTYLAELRKFMHQKMEDTRYEDSQYYVDPFEPDPNPKKSKIYFSDSEFGIQCELVYERSKVRNYRELNFVLRNLCLLDKRVKTIIIAARVFAEESALHDAKYGRLHVVCFALMVVYFLQQLEPPVLPIVDITCKNMEIKHKNSASLGELWLEFLKFYSQTFDWEKDVICITSASKVTKKEKNWRNHLIAIEDPFTGKNIAESVQSSEVAEHVQYCFKNFYENSLAPASDADSDSSENETEMKALSTKYSFDLCKQLKDNLPSCADCIELGGPCGACYKLIPVIDKIPEIDQNSLKYVRSVLDDVVGKNVLSEGNIKGRKAFVSVLEKFIQKKFKLANLSLYGSSVNGFGFTSSDLDICMSFREEMRIKPAQILRGVANFLRRDNTYENVIGIYFAKIPLIKFSSIASLGWKCEISLSNALAVHNSRLLNTYAEFDKRCKILGCALKLLAKKSGIADCVTKTLSSYSYIIMTIHYLQQINPPVLPVFPILHKEEFEDNVILPEKVIKHNHWLSENIFELRERYEYACHNETDIAELWLGLLDFYLQYDLSNAITIIQKEPLSASTLERYARLFNIQDPFLHDKNLGGAVSNEKAHEIMRIFHGARVLFGKEKPKSVTNLKSHYFSTMNLTGKYIKDLDCSLCGAYGHDISKCKKSNQQQSRGKFYFSHRNKV
ncbi:terminal uridylyltransferase 4 isoform X2 [Parasteatoda tepidariorum]|uniref:terminal uridylyltransferase 4 isoform X2 n=1 Tax=Parasteatoda tepidariorum TaxID=114398 RepID=UPI00077F89E5|nr:terminal uridylyltransferase 7 isoform X2 [Parasteatoda tepidariorum]